MPEVLFFREADGHVPTLDWLRSLPAQARQKCLDGLELLRTGGHELRRPHADYLDDGIHELRVKWARINYRMLYFFHGREVVVVSHGFAKLRARVPRQEIDRAIQRRWRFTSAPASYRYGRNQ